MIITHFRGLITPLITTQNLQVGFRLYRVLGFRLQGLGSKGSFETRISRRDPEILSQSVLNPR